MTTVRERIDNYVKATGWSDTLWVGPRGVLLGVWEMGQNYQVKSGFYGGYPAGYLNRIKALYPEPRTPLHLFSGKVDTETFPGDTVDTDLDNWPTFVDNAETLKTVPLERYDLVLADPPYSVEDAVHYGAPMVNRNKVMRALTRLPAGAHVVWLDQVKPMYRKDEWKVYGQIAMSKSTNHRFRIITIFERLTSTGAEGL